MVTASGRSRWPHLIGSAALVIVIGGGIVYSITRPASESTAQPNATPTPTSSTPTPTTPATSSTPDLGDDVAPTGCLGGLDRTVDMVLAAQAEAKHTTFGAVEVATATYRWLWQYPTPPSSESDTVGAEIMATTAPAAWKDVTAQYESDVWKSITSEYQARGGEFHTSSTNGLWRVTEDSTADRVNVELSVGYVVDGALSPTRSTGIGLILVWQNDAWHVENGTVLDQTKLTNGGTRYTGGC
jgi:hypothetical protein